MSRTGREFSFTTGIGRIDMKALGVLYERSWTEENESFQTSRISPAQMFGTGAYGFFALKGEHLIGMARVFSDDLICSWLAEIYVIPDWRGHGVGRSLFDKLNDQFRQTAFYCDASVENVHFFKAAGISPKAKLTVCRRLPVTEKTDLRVIPHVTLHEDASRYCATDFDNVLDSVGFGISDKNMPRDLLYKKLFGDGVFGTFAEDTDGRLIGFARSFSDNHTKCYIAEICVHPEWQHNGIGRSILGRIVRRFSHAVLYAEAFPESVPLLTVCGALPVPDLIGCSRAPLKIEGDLTESLCQSST